MMPLVARMAMAIAASFTLTMLLGATTTWALQQMGSSADLNIILWTFFPTTFFLSSTVLEYLELGSLAPSFRASIFSTAFVAALVVALYVMWYGTSLFAFFSNQ